MKKVIVVLFCIITTGVFAQAPPYINYQAVARDAGGSIVSTPIGVKFEILQGSATGTLIYDETNTIIPSSAGIFTTAIGSGTPGTGTFSSINWATGPYFLRVNIDPSGGTSYLTVGTSQFLSVPYALYATTSGNASTTYSAGSGILISSGSIINTAPNQTVNIYGAGTTTVSGSYPSYTISSSAATSTSVPTSSLVINPPHNITNLGPNNNSITIQPTIITATTGIANINGSYPNYNVFVPPPILTVNGSTIIITQGSASSSQTIGGPWYKPSAGAVSLTNANDNVGIGIPTAGNRLQVVESSNPLAAGNFANTYSVVSNASAMGIFSSASNPHPTSAGVYGTHSSNGNGVSGINTSATSSVGVGVYGYTSGTFSTSASIQADISAGNSTGIFANGFSSHTGIAIFGLKTGNAGHAGKFVINNAGNPTDALFSTTNGFGAAIRSVNGPTVAGSSNVGVWLEAGHLKSTQSVAPTTTTMSVSGGGISGVSFSLGAGSTDVKGVMNVVFTTTLMINSSNNATVRVNFNKSYVVPPVVVVTSLTDLGIMSFFVSNVTTNSFNLTIRNSTSGNMSTAASFPLNFNYIVIE